MVMGALAGMAASAAPGMLRGIGQFTGNAVRDTVGTQLAAAQGRNADIGNSQAVVDYMRQNGLQMTPQQEAHFSNSLSQQDAQFQAGQQKDLGTFGAALDNTQANLRNQRQMALNAQTNAANMATNQIQTAADRARTNADSINRAMTAFVGRG